MLAVLAHPLAHVHTHDSTHTHTLTPRVQMVLELRIPVRRPLVVQLVGARVERRRHSFLLAQPVDQLACACAGP
eukprot:scaffold83539_cov64-Phaeocystis_antarctica.AAC.2